jgi:oxygen-dependent protoporphyrinogen oxidase
MPQYTLGHEERLARIEQGLSNYPGLFLTGSAYQGIGISDCVHQAELTAEQVLEFVKK